MTRLRESQSDMVVRKLAPAAAFVVSKRRLTPTLVRRTALLLLYYANGAGMIQASQAELADGCDVEPATMSRDDGR